MRPQGRAALPREPQSHLSEQRRDRVVTIIFHLANPIAAGANRPPDRVLPRLRGGDLALNPSEHLFCVHEEGRGGDFEVGGRRRRGSLRGHHGDQQA